MEFFKDLYFSVKNWISTLFWPIGCKKFFNKILCIFRVNAWKGKGKKGEKANTEFSNFNFAIKINPNSEIFFLNQWSAVRKKIFTRKIEIYAEKLKWKFVNCWKGEEKGEGKHRIKKFWLFFNFDESVLPNPEFWKYTNILTELESQFRDFWFLKGLTQRLEIQ